MPLLNTNLQQQRTGRLYTFLISHFAGISRVFSQNTPRNMKHSLYTIHISCECCVLLMPQKNKPQNPLTFPTNADPSTKCKKRKKGARYAKKVMQNIPLYTFVFAYFVISVQSVQCDCKRSYTNTYTQQNLSHSILSLRICWFKVCSNGYTEIY